MPKVKVPHAISMPQQKPAADQPLNGGMRSGIGHTDVAI
jgi:hypothetical protein